MNTNWTATRNGHTATGRNAAAAARKVARMAPADTTWITCTAPNGAQVTMEPNAAWLKGLDVAIESGDLA